MLISALLVGADLERRRGVDARVEREDDEGAEDDGHEGREVQHRLERELRGALGGVVTDDRAQAVRAVQHREPQHREVPDLPEGVGPLARDEGEVDLLDALALPQVHEEVADDEYDEQQPGAAHEQPRVHLEVVALARLVGGPGLGYRGQAHRYQCPNTFVRWRHTKGRNRTRNRPTTPYIIWRWYRAPCHQKSTRTIRMPLNAWKSTAATSPTSMRPTTGFL